MKRKPTIQSASGHVVVHAAIPAPLLRWAAVSIYSDNIFRRSKDENGYLMIWGRWVEMVVTIMIIVNALAWWAGIIYASWILGPGLAELSKGMGEAMEVIRGLWRDIRGS
jgi:hypothetical protein